MSTSRRPGPPDSRAWEAHQAHMRWLVEELECMTGLAGIEIREVLATAPKHGATDLVYHRGVWMIPEDRARYALRRSD